MSERKVYYTKSAVKPGDVIGEMTVLRETGEFIVEKDGHRRRVVEVKCSCGNQFKIAAQYLKSRNRCSNCSHHHRRLCEVGNKFDKLTVTGYEKGKDGRPFVVCKCDCGTENVKIRAEVLIGNLTNNCGCDRRGNYKGCGELSSTVFFRIKRGASIRNLVMDVSIEYLWELFFITKSKMCTNRSTSGVFLRYSR